MKTPYLIALFFSLLFLVYGCNSGISGAAVSANSLTGETKEFDIKAKNWNFAPNLITVNKGDKVILHIESLDDGSGAGHGITIPAFGVSKSFRGGDLVTVEFIADKKGTFPFFCSVSYGSGHGDMKGKLVVK